MLSDHRIGSLSLLQGANSRPYILQRPLTSVPNAQSTADVYRTSLGGAGRVIHGGPCSYHPQTAPFSQGLNGHVHIARWSLLLVLVKREDFGQLDRALFLALSMYARRKHLRVTPVMAYNYV